MDTSTTDYFKKPVKKKRTFRFWFFNFILACSFGFVATTVIAYLTIPSVANINDCFITSMYQVDLCPKNKNYVKYNQLPKHLVSSLIATEDSTFFFHSGFDWDGIKDGLEKSLDAGRWVRGGSTLTQQLAKNLYLSKERSLTRKFKEFFVAQKIEKMLTKAQIIEKYFNVVEFGKNIYGIQKASYHYFQKPVGALSPAEGAYLISLLPSPVRYSSTYHSRKDLSSFNKKRITTILSILHHQKKISDETYIYERGRTMNGLWSPYNPVADDGEKKTSDSTESDFGLPQDGDQSPEDIPNASEESPALEEDFE